MRTGTAVLSSRPQRAIDDRAAAATDGDHAGVYELLDTERLQDPQQRLQLVAVPGGLDGHRICGNVNDLGAEQLCGLKDVGAGLHVGPDLDHEDRPLD